MMFKRIICIVAVLEIIAVLAASPILARRLESPKGKEQREQSSTAMARNSAMSIVSPSRPTNRVSRLQFQWGYDGAQLVNVDHFVLKLGTNEGVYTIEEITGGTNLTYVFTRTNWPESSVRHYAVVIAVERENLEGYPSNEAHWPLYPPDHVMLCWSTRYPSVRILSSVDMSAPPTQWTQYAVATDTTNFSTNIDFSVPARFFVIDKPESLALTLFNPNP